MSEPQPEALTAFLMSAEYHILQAPHGSDEDAGESLISAGCFYAPRLLAAVEAVLALVDPPTTVAVTDLDGNWETVRRVVDCGKVGEAISSALLGEQ